MLTTYTSFQLTLAALFERTASSITTQPLEEQWYWPKVLELERLARGGLHPAVWCEELLRRLL